MLYARPSSSRDTDEFFRDRMYGELWVGRRPSLKEISDSLGLEVRHIDELAAGPGQYGQDARAPRRLLARRHDGRRRRRARRRLRPRHLRDAADQGRLGGRRAADRLRHHRPGLRGQRGRVGPRPGVRRALDRGHLLPPRPRDGQRHRLRLDRRRRLARHHAALDREHRPDHARRRSSCSTWASRATTSTPPTSPAPCRSTAPSPRSSATSTRSSTRRRRPASPR